MEHAARRPMVAIATLTTAGALALAPVTVAPREMHMPSLSPTLISNQAIQLTDAWSDLATSTVQNVIALAGLTYGANSNFPLPSPTVFVAPIATQLVLNQLIYLGQLFTGHGAQIPAEIATHLNGVAQVVGGLAGELPPVIVKQLQTPIAALSLAAESITTSSNLLIGLLESPAVFLNFALNSQYGLIGYNGPIAIPIIVRNLVAKAIDPPLPGWLANILQPGKAPSAAARTPKPAASTVTLKVTPSGTASSARSKSKASASSSRKAAAAHSSDTSGAHSKRG